MQKYTKEIYKKSFTAVSGKEAYLKACKWLAKNVISSKEIADNCEYAFKKRDDKGQLFVDLVVSVVMSKEEADNRHCSICRENHNSFLLNDNVQCNDCKLSAYHKREADLIETKAKYIKDRLEGRIKENEK